MQIEVSKSELAGALPALGKMVCRMSAAQVYSSLRIEGKNNKISFQTAGLDDAITYTIPAEGIEEFAAIVNFDEFRTIVRASRNKSLVLSCEPGKFGIDHCLIRTFNLEWPIERVEEGDCEVSDLPENFIGLLGTAAPIVNRVESRRILQGIHLCKDGIVVTNGKELLHIDIPLTVDTLTIPFSHALLATKSSDSGRVATWCDKEFRFFRFEFGSWRWSGKALVGSYPDWRRVIPQQETLGRIVKLDPDNAARLTVFLKGIPDNPPNNPVTLSMGENSTLKVVSDSGMETSIEAAFSCDWGDFKLTVNKTLLLRLLSEGHCRLAIGDDHSPFLATGGIGRYIAMPIAYPPKPQVQPVQPQPKEESTMNAMPNVVTTPIASPVTPITNPEPVAVNPLDELAAAVDDFKSRIRAMFDESTLLSRKVKEVALAQKQKERDFVQAKRAIERIRMAI